MAGSISIEALAARVDDGARLALPPEYSYVPMALVAALIDRGVRDLDLLCVPIGGLAADMLIGSGCVRSLEAAAVSLGEAGPAPRFTEAVESGAIVIRDTTCPAIHTALQAAEKGVPFMPLGGLIGSDLVAGRADWKVVDDPMEAGTGPIVLLPAIKPDVAIFHSPLADRNGNVWIGRRRELATMAHAATQTLVTVERLTDDDFLADEATAAAALPGFYVTAIAEAAGGCRPLGLAEHYAADTGAIGTYAREARTADGFNAWMGRRTTVVRIGAAE